MSFLQVDPHLCFDLSGLRARYVEKPVDVSSYCPKDKGAWGKEVERMLRADPLLAHLPWVSETQGAPDMGVCEIKTVVLRPGKNGLQVTQDLAIGQLALQVFSSTLEQSPLAAKLNMLLVALRPETFFTARIQSIHELDFRMDAQARKDFMSMSKGFWGRHEKMGAAQAIDALGSGTEGYGKVLIAKTKGARRRDRTRPRGLYVRARAIRRALADSCLDRG